MRRCVLISLAAFCLFQTCGYHWTFKVSLCNKWMSAFVSFCCLLGDINLQFYKVFKFWRDFFNMCALASYRWFLFVFLNFRVQIKFSKIFNFCYHKSKPKRCLRNSTILDYMRTFEVGLLYIFLFDFWLCYMLIKMLWNSIK